MTSRAGTPPPALTSTCSHRTAPTRPASPPPPSPPSRPSPPPSWVTASSSSWPQWPERSSRRSRWPRRPATSECRRSMTLWPKWRPVSAPVRCRSRKAFIWSTTSRAADLSSLYVNLQQFYFIMFIVRTYNNNNLFISDNRDTYTYNASYHPLTYRSASTLISVPTQIMTCQCLLPWFLAISSFTRSRHLSFGLPRFLFPSAAICNIVPEHHLYLAFARVQTISTSSFSENLPSGTCVPLSRCLHFSHDLVFSSCHPPRAHFIRVKFYPPPFCSVRYGRFYSYLSHFVFQLQWYVSVTYHSRKQWQVLLTACTPHTHSTSLNVL